MNAHARPPASGALAAGRDHEFGPATAPVRALLERFTGLDPADREALRSFSRVTWRDGPLRGLQMPWEFAWKRVGDALTAHDLTDAFARLWECLEAMDAFSGRDGLVAADAMAATMLRPLAGGGPFRVCDVDTLMAPWRSAVDGCTRSRAALAALRNYPREVDEDWWAALDAVLAPPAGGVR